jgi:hypothetical protein
MTNCIKDFVVGQEVELEMGLSTLPAEEHFGKPDGYPRWILPYERESAGWIKAVITDIEMETWATSNWVIVVEWKTRYGNVYSWQVPQQRDGSFLGIRPITSRCECGAVKCGTTHSTWCPAR